MGAQDVRKCSASFNPIHEEEKPSTYCGWLRKMLVPTRWSPSFTGRNRSLAVLLSHLIEVDADEATTEAISDWHYSLAVATRSDPAGARLRAYAALPKGHIQIDTNCISVVVFDSGIR